MYDAIIAEVKEREGPEKFIIVYATKSGKQYHTQDCERLGIGGGSISLHDAKQRGCRPCKECEPPE